MSARRPRQGSPGIRVSVTDGRGRPIRGGESAGLGAWLSRWAPSRATGAVSIALVSDTAMRILNRRFRGVDQPTDVLSFPRDQARRRGLAAHGDLAIARGVARRQATEMGHSLRTELRVLALHGLLHLLGYDHEVDRGQMARLEERLRRRAGLASGLIARQRSRRLPQ